MTGGSQQIDRRRAEPTGPATDPHRLPAHAVFERVARDHPDRTATVCGRDRVTYAHLNTWANAIAAALIDAGLCPEEPVALAVPKSAAQVAGVLGILKAGGAYVPIVANQPADRLRAIVADTACRFAVADPAYLPEVTAGVAHRLHPDDFREQSAPNPDRPVGPDDLAYVIYTSGSTGRPKGVMIEHAGIVRLVHDQDYMPFGPDLHFLYGGPLSFDLSTIELFTPLLHGAKLLISPDDVLTPEVVRHFAEREGVGAVFISFSLLRALFEADAGAFERVPVIGTGGEPVDARFICTLQQRLPGTRFFAAFGPTECTALTTAYPIPDPCPLDPPVVPIGRPLNRMRTRIVGPDGAPTPPGQPGELLIGGVGVARGYLNDPETTRAKFVPDPDIPGQRLYRSGDLVVELPDGNIGYLGRIDDQVKIRGQRIELGEIDAVLAADPHVRAAASVVIGSGEGAHVASCVVPTDPDAFDPDALARRVARRLTSAMMPAPIVPVAAIPINRNGKADRDRVREAVRAHQQRPAAQSVTHDDPALRRLLDLCSGVLGEPVAADRSFVALGGNSLRAMVLRMRVREALGADLSVPRILTAPTLADLAADLSCHPATAGRAPAPDPDERLPPGPVPMSPAQTRLWTLQQFDPGNAAYNVGLTFRFRRPPDLPALRAAWSDLHRRHAALRTRFLPGDDAPRAELLKTVEPVLVETANLGDDPSRVRAELRRPFRLDRAPLARLVVSQDAAGWSGLLVMHHVVSDAWSLEVMLRDLFALAAGRAGSLPPVPLGQPEHAARSARVAADPNADAAARCAAQPFAARPPTHARFIDPGAHANPEAVSTHADLPPELVARINQLAADHGASAHAVLLAAAGAWAAPFCAVDEPAIGLAVSTRDDGPFADAVGFFVETVPVLLPAAPRWTDTVPEVAARVRAAHERRAVPFELIARHAAQPAAPGRTPITEVFFNLIDRAPLDSLQPLLDAAQPEFVEADSGLARFDLVVTVYRAPDAWRLVVTARDAPWAAGPAPAAASLLGFIESGLAGRTPGPTPAADAPRRPDTPRAPAATVQDGDRHVSAIVSVFREVLDDPGFGPHDNFFDRGGNSLQAVRAFARIHERLGTKVPTSAIFRAQTPAELAAIFQRDAAAAPAPGLVRMNDAPDARPLYLVPGIQGHVVSFAPLAQRLSATRPCLGFEFPGIDDDREPIRTIPAIAEHFIAQLRLAPSDRAPDLVGYSFGGVVAFEMARQLQEAGHAPGLLVLLDSYRPGSYPMRNRLARMLIHARTIAALPRADRRLYLTRKLRSLRARLGTPSGPARSAPARTHEQGAVYAHNRAALDAYQAPGVYRGPALVVRGRRPHWMQFHHDDGANGWRAVLAGPVRITDVDAEHSHLLRAEFADEIAAQIQPAG